MNYNSENVFAKILRKELPAEIIYEDEMTLVIMDIMPRANGHMLVIPKSPCRNMLDATDEQLSACISTVKKISNGAIRAFEADGITIQQFNEAAGGQEVFHLHFHVLPRKIGIPLRPHDGKMVGAKILKSNAAKMKSVL